MSRVKRGTIANKKRKKILKYTKGFKWGRKSKEIAAKEALLHAWTHAFQGRKQKKRDFRALWNVKIGIAAKANGTKYSELINKLNKAKIKLNRKMLAELTLSDPKVFAKIVEKAK
ncbi:MAG: 50S ribosomal protein L20 [Candidatus Pacebacteria bacterium]|nr:50S ribosomal protein L20 [Candidatus Paceibacterota bacterium]